MTHQDRLEAEKIDAKNSVEEYVYDMRDKISTSLKEFISEEVIRLYLLSIILRFVIPTHTG